MLTASLREPEVKTKSDQVASGSTDRLSTFERVWPISMITIAGVATVAWLCMLGLAIFQIGGLLL